jgi:hypothetical protein
MANAIIRRQLRKVAAAIAVAESKKQVEKFTVVEEIKPEVAVEAVVSAEVAVETPAEESVKTTTKKKKTVATLTE